MQRFVVFMFLMYLFYLPVNLWAQEKPSPSSWGELEKGLNVDLSLRAQALEKAIDADTYLVGPGDVFNIGIWGIVNENFTIQVSPEGHLIVPMVDDFDVNQQSLSMVKKQLREGLGRVFLNSDITISLVSVRKFRVSVTGAVMFPGSYVVTATDRVSEAIQTAGGFQVIDEPRGKQNPNLLRPSLRNIHLIRQNQKFRVDLLAYQDTGDKSLNPHLSEGDVINVPYLSENTGYIHIFGSVNKPSQIEFTEGDHISNIIRLAHGFRIDADTSKIEVVRFVEKDETQTFIVAAGADDFELQPDDRIFVRSLPNFHKKKMVMVEGEVNYPGNYVIEEGVTKLSDVIEHAGGFTEDASLSESRLIRQAKEDLVDPEYERLKLMTVEEMTDIEYAYFKSRSRQKVGTVAVDFVKLFEKEDASQDIILRDRDMIQVPTYTQTVTIIGAVKFPGITTYVPGETIGYYIKTAGDYSWDAKKSEVRLIKAISGEWVRADEATVVGLGDTIFVPEKPKRDYWTLFKDVLLVTTQVATLVLVIQNVSK